MFFGFGICSENACNATSDTHQFDTIHADSVYSKAATACLDGGLSAKACDDVTDQLAKDLTAADRKGSVASQPSLKRNEEEPQKEHCNWDHCRTLSAQTAAQRARETAQFEEQEARRAHEDVDQQCISKSQEELLIPEDQAKREGASCAATETLASKGSHRSEREAEEIKKKSQIDDFLRAHGFSKLNSKRMGKFGRYKYPLHTAVKREPDILPLLLEAGADPSRKNSAGLTPLQYAQKVNAFEAERLLCDRPAFHRGVKQHSSG